jgi:hypothetical protein
MPLQFNGDVVFQQIQLAAAKGMLEAALLFVEEYRKRVSVPNPAPYKNSSRPGEYPRLRTGEGRRQLVLDPPTVAGAKSKGFVWVRFTGDAHLYLLEYYAERLGLERTMLDMKSQMADKATAAFRAGS